MSKRPTSSLWPREHGAYAQLGIALGAALALAPAARGLGQAVCTAALFLASEPLLVLLGRRGELGAGVAAQARRRLGCLVGAAALSGTWTWIGRPIALLGSLLPVTVLGLGLFGLFLGRRERTPGGEALAALTFAGAALPVAVAGGATPRNAVALTLLLAAVFFLGTLLAPIHVYWFYQDLV